MSRTSRAGALERTSTSVSFDSAAAPALDVPSTSHDSLLQELEIEFAEKVGQMRELSDRLALRLEANFRCEMLKLPKPVRNMPMREFCITYGGDVDEALKQQAKQIRGDDALLMPPPRQPPPEAKPAARGGGKTAAPAAAPSSARGKRGAAAAGVGEGSTTETPGVRGRATRSRVAPAATPNGAAKGLATPAAAGGAAAAFTPRIHETPRMMQRGEVALSANGSPIMLNTVKAHAGKRGRGTSDAGPSVLVAMADGSELDMSDSTAVKDLEANGEARDMALSQLEELQARVADHIKALKAPGGVPELP
jgi:hypothetical protein